MHVFDILQSKIVQLFNVHFNASNGRSNAPNGHWAFSTVIYYSPNAVQKRDVRNADKGVNSVDENEFL